MMWCIKSPLFALNAERPVMRETTLIHFRLPRGTLCLDAPASRLEKTMVKIGTARAMRPDATRSVDRTRSLSHMPSLLHSAEYGLRVRRPSVIPR